MSINRVALTGNLTRDAELTATAGGTQVLHFGIAVNDRRKNPQSGEWEDVPNFVDLVMFGARADAVSRYLSKGSKVAVEGRLRYSAWEKDGQKRSKLEVIVDEIEFMSRSDGGQRQAPAQAPQQAYTPPQNAVAAPPAVQAQINQTMRQAAQAGAVQPEVYDEDIPF